MTEEELDILEMNMPRIKAIRVLERARAGEIDLSADAWQHYTFLETGSAELAEQAKMNVRKARMRAGMQTY